MHVREQKDKQAELMVKFHKAVETEYNNAKAKVDQNKFGVAVGGFSKPSSGGNMSPANKGMGAGDLNDGEASKGDENKLNPKDSAVMSSQGFSESVAGQQLHKAFAGKTFGSSAANRSFYQRQPSIKYVVQEQELTRKGKQELIEAKIAELEGHVETSEELFREIHFVSKSLLFSSFFKLYRMSKTKPKRTS